MTNESASVGQRKPKALRISRSYYLRPDQVRAIDDACLDLPALLRQKLSPSKVMEKFVDDSFESWIKALKARATQRRGRNGDSD